MARTKQPIGIRWEQIEELLHKGFGARDIAALLGCSAQNVAARIKRQQEKTAPAQTGAVVGADEGSLANSSASN